MHNPIGNAAHATVETLLVMVEAAYRPLAVDGETELAELGQLLDQPDRGVRQRHEVDGVRFEPLGRNGEHFLAEIDLRPSGTRQLVTPKAAQQQEPVILPIRSIE